MNIKNIQGNKKYIIVAVIITVIIAMGFYFFRGDEKVERNNTIYVETMDLSEENIEMENTYPGIIKGEEEAPLAFQVAGRINNKYVKIGDQVKKGQVLMTLDDTDLKETVSALGEKVEGTKSQLDLAKTTLHRFENLYSQNAISKQKLDEVRGNYNLALANFNASQSEYNRGLNSLNYTKIIAPKDGVIGSILADLGQVVPAGQGIINFATDDDFVVEINVPENKINSIKIGDRVKVILWSNKEEVLGKIAEISPMANLNTGTYLVKIKLDKGNNINLGMNVKVLLPKKITDEIVLPLSAIYKSTDTEKVFVVEKEGDKEIARLKPIKVVEMTDDKVVVKGLARDEIVITKGVNKLAEGTEVKRVTGDTR